MINKPRQKTRLNKIDAVIVVILIIIAGLVLTKAGYIPQVIENEQPDFKVKDEDIPPPPLPTPPESITAGYMRSVSPEDEGVHFDKIGVSREWWYFSVILEGKNSELNDWAISISFDHLARGDLLGTLKPDLLVVSLHGPNGKEYGGMINKERGLGILEQPTLTAKTPGVSIKFEDSWAEGGAPEWHVHVEDNEIDKDHEIIIDLTYFAPAEPFWTVGNLAFDKTNRNLAGYIFTGCNVTGTIEIDGEIFTVKGTGHHEHVWTPNVVTRIFINGWDWSHISLDNGWNIYFSNYYPFPQSISTKTSNFNSYGSLIITTDKGDTLTILNKIEPEITESDDQIFPFVKMPIALSINAKPDVFQPLLASYDVNLELEIIEYDTLDKIWKFPTYVGMKLGMSTVSGKLSWIDDDGNQEVELNGIGTIWSMRALI